MKILLLIFLLGSCAQASPNFIFLFADDQRADTIGAHGNPHIHTPNLDRLSAEGFSFRRNYCAGSYSGAVCVASRAMLMTGRHWMRIPSTKNWQGLPLLPALLSEKANYRPYIVGKWHNGKHNLDQAFQQGGAVYMGGMADHTNFQVQDLKDGTLGTKRKAAKFSSTEFANAAIDFIGQADQAEPFFLYVAFTAPHDPRNPPEPYRERYYKKRPPLPANYRPSHPFQNAPQVTMGRDEGLAPWPRTREVISDQLCEYYGLVTQLDEQVGRIMQALEASPHAKNTHLIYTADHGLAMGSHGLLGKQNVYEQSMSSPLILRGPNIPVGSSRAFTYVHDLYTTICGLAGVELPVGIDAKDLAPLWQGKKESVRDSLYLPFQNNQRAINDGRWKLHVYPLINHRLLFDLQSDPHEMKDLAGDPAHAGALNRLDEIMAAWRERIGDRHPLQSEKPAAKVPVFDNSTRKPDRWQPKWIRDKYFGGSEPKPRK